MTSSLKLFCFATLLVLLTACKNKGNTSKAIIDSKWLAYKVWASKEGAVDEEASRSFSGLYHGNNYQFNKDGILVLTDKDEQVSTGTWNEVPKGSDPKLNDSVYEFVIQIKYVDNGKYADGKEVNETWGVTPGGSEKMTFTRLWESGTKLDLELKKQ